MVDDNTAPLVYTVTARVEIEKATMITESRIELLESLAKKAQNFEKVEPKWELFKTGRSAFGSTFVVAISCLMPEILKNNAIYFPSTLTELMLDIFCIVGVFGLLLCQIIIYTNSTIKDETYKTSITEIIDILRKMKNSLNGAIQDPQT